MKTFRIFVALVATLVLFLAAAPASADPSPRCLIHHESQGDPSDQSWTKCMPCSSWNGHEHHQGDWKKDSCEQEPTATPVITNTPPIWPTATPGPSQTPGPTATPGGPPPTATPPAQLGATGGHSARLGPIFWAWLVGAPSALAGLSGIGFAIWRRRRGN